MPARTAAPPAPDPAAVPLPTEVGLPIGVQIIAALWREHRIAHRARWSGRGRGRNPARHTLMAINRPDVIAKVTAEFARCEAAPMASDVLAGRARAGSREPVQ